MNTKAIKTVSAGKEGIFLQYVDGTFDILAWEVVKLISESAVKYHEELTKGSQVLN